MQIMGKASYNPLQCAKHICNMGKVLCGCVSETLDKQGVLVSSAYTYAIYSFYIVGLYNANPHRCCNISFLLVVIVADSICVGVATQGKKANRSFATKNDVVGTEAGYHILVRYLVFLAASNRVEI